MIGERIRIAREAAKLTRRQLARAAGVHYNTVLYVERGDMTPSTVVLDKLCRALNLEVTFPLDAAPK
jgi:putative transcriptional regulator